MTPPSTFSANDQRETDLLGGVVVPAIAAIIYGVVQLFRHGLSQQFAAFTYLPVLGGVASVIATVAHIATLKAPEGRSLSLTAGALAVFVPYVFSLYLMSYLGVWSIYRAIVTHPILLGHLFLGALWLLIGWRLLYVLGKINRGNIRSGPLA